MNDRTERQELFANIALILLAEGLVAADEISEFLDKNEEPRKKLNASIEAMRPNFSDKLKRETIVAALRMKVLHLFSKQLIERGTEDERAKALAYRVTRNSDTRGEDFVGWLDERFAAWYKKEEPL